MCELAKRIEVPVSMDFMAISSYGADTKSSGVIKIVKDLDDSIEGKDVLVVEDIIDSGRTLSKLMELLDSRKPASLALCTLLDKPERRVVEVDVDYTGFQIPDLFVVGYGLDCAQKHRNYPYVGTIKSILNGESQNPGSVTIKKLCDAFEITLGQFYSTPEFDALEQEIK